MAVEEIRKGEAYIRTEDGMAPPAAKQALDSSERQLDRLAKEVGKGSLTTVKELDGTFARADNAVALSHQLKASESWTKRDATRTGYELKASARSAEQAAAWAGNEVEAATSSSVTAARSVAAKLAAGTGYTVEEVRKALDSMGKRISDLGKRAS